MHSWKYSYFIIPDKPQVKLRPVQNNDLVNLKNISGPAATSEGSDNDPVRRSQLSPLSFDPRRGVNLTDWPNIALAVHMQDLVNRHIVFFNDKWIQWHIFNGDAGLYSPMESRITETPTSFLSSGTIRSSPCLTEPSQTDLL